MKWEAKHGGLALVVVGLLVGGIFVATQDKSTGTASCALTTGGLAALTVAAHREASAAAVFSSVALPAACAAFVSKVVEQPNETVKATVKLPEGGSETYERTGEELISTPPAEPRPQPGIDLQLLIECGRWNNEVLSQLCFDGRIGPPSSSY